MAEMEPENLPAADQFVRAAAELAPGLRYRVSGALAEVVDAWQLVYSAYVRGGLIEPNTHRIHLAPQAVTLRSAVIAGAIGPVTVSTLTAIVDPAETGRGGVSLPLDRVYGEELAALRRSGRKLMEIGLFADRRKNLSRSAESLFQLMRFAFYYGIANQVTDFVIGVHPRHARFYTRALGFEQVGSLRTYPAVNDRPVVLLRGDMDLEPSLRHIHPALVYFKKNPVPIGTFDGRYAFPPAELAGSVIEAFLREKYPVTGPALAAAPLSQAG